MGSYTAIEIAQDPDTPLFGVHAHTVLWMEPGQTLPSPDELTGLWKVEAGTNARSIEIDSTWTTEEALLHYATKHGPQYLCKEAELALRDIDTHIQLRETDEEQTGRAVYRLRG